MFGKLWAAMQGLAQQPGKQRDKGHADQGNAAARDQLLDALALAAGVFKLGVDVRGNVLGGAP